MNTHRAKARESSGLRGYLQQWVVGIRTTWQGLRLTHRHLRAARRRRRTPQAVAQPGYFQQPQGAVTITYPHESLPLPEVGRNQLYVEIDDCIGCDQCARICPVDCIDIQKIQAPDTLSLTSDGTKVKFWLPVFDIDMAKCCYCGLCTVVCPTECIIMTPTFDYSTPSRNHLVFSFGNLTPEQAAQKQAEWEAYEAERKRLKEETLAKAKAAKTPPTPDA